jgi:hypothetical protein
MNQLPILCFPEHLKYSSRLSASGRILLDVFVINMRDSDNLIYFCEGGLEAYKLFCKEELNIEYSTKTVRSAISELTKKGLIIRQRNNIYYVNPNLYFKLERVDRRKSMIDMVNTLNKNKEQNTVTKTTNRRLISQRNSGSYASEEFN